MTEEEVKLANALEQLNEWAFKIVETQGYSKDAQRAKMLAELIKEQLKNANSRSTTRKAR